MQQQTAKEPGENENRYLSYRQWDVQNAVDRYIVERGINHFCHVTVHLKNHWFELDGTIDGQWTRAILFSLVPKTDGNRFIIDKLKIATPPPNTAPLT